MSFTDSYCRTFLPVCPRLQSARCLAVGTSRRRSIGQVAPDV